LLLTCKRNHLLATAVTLEHRHRGLHRGGDRDDRWHAASCRRSQNALT